ncbi:asparagine synthase C-terminal domain-containing protein [Helicobacter sp. MIT 21-1697]|uniref:asparagine synthase-related protein n=1 Tax=Helicobacter sp. MIT 21-1697 TaxID=2993733 RepID=UPI00224AF0E9|nr:asparagine synthase C-terminal domain-containing protein [Helicobacter sp. MIT 21-1697]MCX2717608.1 asparagine synthase C-terminal domain-containing protein [Helicobacter sp. MIT 21-1697]
MNQHQKGCNNQNKVDKDYCASHYLAFRFIKDENMNFFKGLSHKVFKPKPENELLSVQNVADIDRILQSKIEEYFIPNKTALLLSSGIDSAILASYLPPKTPCITFKCIAPNAIDETHLAKKYCQFYDLEHHILEIMWEDFLELTPMLLKHNQVPFHSIEVQLLKAVCYAKSLGYERIIIGDGADYVFYGMDKLLSQDWDFDAFMHRYNFIEPQKILHKAVSVQEVYEPYRLANNKIDFLGFLKDIMNIESYTSYMHAFECGKINYLDPYVCMKMAQSPDLRRIRNGEPKYLLRELFAQKYPSIALPNKIPMPRAMGQWLQNWTGPKRSEFKRDCIKSLNGDQKWLVWCLEQFFNLYDKEDKC